VVPSGYRGPGARLFDQSSFTLEAAAYCGHENQRWPVLYAAGQEQFTRLTLRDRSEKGCLKNARPISHSVSMRYTKV